MIGILGGTFDPIHEGHLHVATQVLRHLPVTCVQMMPCATPVHRTVPLAAAVHRRAMIEVAIAGRDALELNPLELEREGPSYTVDSLRALHARDNRRLCLILGSDAFNGFADWEAPDEILRLAHLVVCLRPGQSPDPGLYAAQRVARPEALDETDAGAILMLDIEPNQCSSTAVRTALARGEMPLECLCPGVVDYIETHGLYRNPSD